MIKLIPKKIQWKKWTLLSKASYIGFILSIFGLIYTITKDIYIKSKEVEYTSKQQAQIQALYSFFNGEITHQELLDTSESLNNTKQSIKIRGFDKEIKRFYANDSISKKELYSMPLEAYSGVLEYSLDSISYSVFNCEEYKSFRKFGYPLNNIELKADSYFYCYCSLMDLLQEVKPAKLSYIKDIGFTEIRYWVPDLLSFKKNISTDTLYFKSQIKTDEALFRFELQNEHLPKSIKDLISYDLLQITDIKKNSISFNYTAKDDTGDAVYCLEILRGDLNNDQIEDIVVYKDYYDHYGGTLGSSDIEIWTMYKGSTHFEKIKTLSSERIP